MKKPIIAILFLFILAMTACSQEEQRTIELQPYTLADLAKMDFTGVNKIEVQDGETGDITVVEDQAVISNWFKEMEDAYFTPDINQKKRLGWTYLVTLYEDKKKLFEFYPTNIDDIYFKPDDKVMASIKKLYNPK